ncbi:MAG: GNAT family N-acetyltransferase [Candidatus Eisenbacteria bacterium]
MAAAIDEIGPERLNEYSQVPTAFMVTSVLSMDSVDGGLGGILFREKTVQPPYIKDYDACDDGGPLAWPGRFDVRNWGFLLAREKSRPVGGAAVAFATPGVHMLAGRRDLAVLWDIRVHPGVRRSGIGSALFERAVGWARTRGAGQLKIETQNINVPACRFYAKQGCHLGEIDSYAYRRHPDFAHEVMLIWYFDL